MKFTFWDFLASQLKKDAPAISVDMSGKVLMVVGANTGLGYEACVQLARMNPAKLIVTARSKEKAQDTVERLAKETNYRADFMVLELAKFSSVKTFIEDFEKKETRLDALVLNAALATLKYTSTEDNWESSIQVNNLSSSWLALRLLPIMQDTAKKYGGPPRLSIVTSSVHNWANWDDELLSSPSIYQKLSDEKYFHALVKKDPRAQYANTRLASVFFARELASKVSSLDDPSERVIVNYVSPGLCKSDLGREMDGFLAITHGIMVWLLGFSTQAGARQILCGVLAGKNDESEEEQVKKYHGAYLQVSAVWEPSDFVVSRAGKDVQQRIWDETIEILAKQDPKVHSLWSFGATKNGPM